jgi:hypothetical protein
MVDDDDAMSANFFDVSGAPVRRLPEEPPPARSEDDYGANVIPLGSPRKRTKEGWKAEWQMSENGSPLPNLFNVLIALRWHPKLTSVVRLDEIECAIFMEKAVADE